jgi:DNA-binding transcriptional LysR family regulator
MDQLRAMRVFVRAVDEGSLAGAARALDLAPAGVTRILAELEAHLDARLLHRTTRRLALTEAGERYLLSARRLLAELDEADAEAGAASTEARGTLRVMAPPAFAVHQLAPLLPLLHERHPRLRLEVSAAGAVESVDAHHDVSIVSLGLQPLQGDFIVRPLAASTFVLCASPAYLARHGCPAAPEELPGHAGLMPAVPAVRRELTLYRVKDASPPRRSAPGPGDSITLPEPQPLLSTAQLELLLAAAQAGSGIAGLPSFLAAPALREGRLQRVLPGWQGGRLTLHAAMPTRRHLPARSRAFVDLLVERFGGSLERDPWLAQCGTMDVDLAN